MQRARILLASADGTSTKQISTELGMSRTKVQRWLDRYEAEGLEGIDHDRPRTGRARRISAGVEEEVVRITLETEPPRGTRWSSRLMAEVTGLHFTQVAHIWRVHGIEPVRRFKLSRDLQFVSRVRDVVGLYVSPPERVIVFSCEEGNDSFARQAESDLPPKERPTLDHGRESVTTLFAGLDVVTGGAVQEFPPRHEEFLCFLQRVEKEADSGVDLDFVLDNYGRHGYPKVHTWLACRPRVHFHLLPTSSSWLSLVGRFLNELSRRTVGPPVGNHLNELIEAIDCRVGGRDSDPRPFVWSPSARSKAGPSHERERYFGYN